MIITNINTLTILQYCCSVLRLLLDTGSVIVHSSRPKFILYNIIFAVAGPRLICFSLIHAKKFESFLQNTCLLSSIRKWNPDFRRKLLTYFQLRKLRIFFLRICEFFVPMLGFITYQIVPYQIVTYQIVVFITYQIVLTKLSLTKMLLTKLLLTKFTLPKIRPS